MCFQAFVTNGNYLHVMTLISTVCVILIHIKSLHLSSCDELDLSLILTVCGCFTYKHEFLFFTLTSFCTNIRPTMLFDAKHMRIPLKFHI